MKSPVNRLLVVVLAVAALAAVGCTSGGALPWASTPEDASTTTAPAPAPTQPPVPSNTSNTTTVSSACGGSLEGCFTYTQMDDYLDAVAPMVDEFFKTQYPNVAFPRNIVYVARGQGARTACGVSDSGAYEYCPGNQTIYVGQDTLWAFYRQAGDAAPAIGLAHEWGHHLQFMLDLPAFGSESQAIAVENQADCIAGAWAKFAEEKGWLEEDDDLKDAGTLLKLIGSGEGPGRDHGTAAERLQAFQMSYEGGIKACNSYFPRSPVA